MSVCVWGGGGLLKLLCVHPALLKRCRLFFGEPEGLLLDLSQRSRYTTFLFHYSWRLFTSSTIPGFAWPFLSPLMSCVFNLVIIFWLLDASAKA